MSDVNNMCPALPPNLGVSTVKGFTVSIIDGYDILCTLYSKIGI